MTKKFNFYGEKKTINELRAQAFCGTDLKTLEGEVKRSGRNSSGREQALEKIVKNQFDAYQNNNAYGNGDGGEGYLLDWIVLKDLLNAFKRLMGHHLRLKEENKELKKEIKELEISKAVLKKMDKELMVTKLSFVEACQKLKKELKIKDAQIFYGGIYWGYKQISLVKNLKDPNCWRVNI